MSEPKKSNFSVTCSLLSQYLKEKRGLGRIDLDFVPSRPEDPSPGLMASLPTPTTMRLLPGADVSGDAETETDRNATEFMELFPQQAGVFAAADQKESDTKEAVKGQLTIFYCGKVVVFDHFPADKADDLMHLAAKGSAVAAPAPSAKTTPPPVSCPPATGSKPDPAPAAVSSPSASPAPPAESAMPIARRASLHRFFAKRKDRITSKAPYQVSGGDSPAASLDSSKPEGSHERGKAPFLAERGSGSGTSELIKFRG